MAAIRYLACPPSKVFVTVNNFARNRALLSISGVVERIFLHRAPRAGHSARASRCRSKPGTNSRGPGARWACGSARRVFLGPGGQQRPGPPMLTRWRLRLAWQTTPPSHCLDWVLAHVPGLSSVRAATAQLRHSPVFYRINARRFSKYLHCAMGRGSPKSDNAGYCNRRPPSKIKNGPCQNGPSRIPSKKCLINAFLVNTGSKLVSNRYR